MYVVQEGDSYWRIAQKQWGDGNLWRHIRDANPNVAENDLRPKMTIRIPPRPRTEAASVAPTSTGGRASPKHGTTSVDPLTGKRYYVVKKGDNGFWGVSVAVFGTPRHMGAIQAANPGLNPRELRPGMKVVIPSGLTAAAPSVAAGPAPTAPRRSGPTTRPAGVRVRTGAPATTVLPDGRVFD